MLFVVGGGDCLFEEEDDDDEKCCSGERVNGIECAPLTEHKHTPKHTHAKLFLWKGATFADCSQTASSLVNVSTLHDFWAPLFVLSFFLISWELILLPIAIESRHFLLFFYLSTCAYCQRALLPEWKPLVLEFTCITGLCCCWWFLKLDALSHLILLCAKLLIIFLPFYFHLG